MGSYGAPPEGEATTEAPQLSAYNQAAGLISSLTGAPHHSSSTYSTSPALDLLQGIQLAGPQRQAQQPGHSGLPPFGSLGLRPGGPFDAGRKGSSAEPGEKQLCTFFLRTGTCAYGDRCKFSHPANRPPPQLNTRGYPVRSEEPDCAHYLKKGWCAFGPTCKFNHPEMPILNSYGLSQPPTAYVSLPTTTFPSPAVYSVPSAVPTLYYLPPGVGPNQLAGSAVGLLPSSVGVGAVTTSHTQASQLAFSQQGALAAAAPAQMYRQASVPYGGVGGGMGGGVGVGVGGAMPNNVSVLEAFQGLTLGRGSGLVQRK
ncbi:hypothetical protein PLESTB_000864900 [Pleodorina starrii]|uniref:C3H1-type domain-containing protein n=1 Tax=Pleodorina starrii TaxID=330485 RepID=A0A9W6F3H2_9CHLO|nr:hypothetical protein PLESTM_001429000 [Pleodorina starrii]GLC54450.1 hypothetical protein PLESTB_000864900 [Pleodorina starrii]GLC72105.1 hypothetical protein PLESTF_001204300 [Pleodorina starrii]